MSLAQAHVVHGGARRTRIRVPTKRGDHDYFRRTAAALKACPGVEEVEPNALTGSLLVRHDASLGDIGDFAEIEKLFKLSEQIPAVATVTHRLIDLAKAFDHGLREATGGRLNGLEATSLTLLVLGLYKLAKSDILPPASTLFWYAAATLAVARNVPEAINMPTRKG